MNVDREPSQVGLAMTAVASLVGVAGTLLAGTGIALLGVPLTVGGVYRCSRRLLAFGVATLFVGVVAAGTSGVPPSLVVLAMLGTLLAWDIGDNAISVAQQLRAEARTDRLEVVHAATSTLVAAFFGIGAYIVFLLSTGGQPGVALVLLVVGAVVVLAALD